MTQTTNENSDLILMKTQPKKAINKFAIPMIISMLIMMLNNMIDSIWVAGLGSGQLAAVGFVTPLFLIISGLGNGIGTGANSLISRYVGKGDKNVINNASIHSIILTVVFSLIITILLLFFLENILILFGAKEVLSYSLIYGSIIILGIFFQYVAIILSAILRSEGAFKRAMYPMIMTAIVNFIIDPIFIYTLNLNIAGAALATVIATSLSIVPMSYWLFIKKDTFIQLTFRGFKNKLCIYKDILSVGLPASLEQIILAIVSIVVNSLLVFTDGTMAVATYTVVWRLISVGIAPATGISVSTVTVGGVAYGAKNFENLTVTKNHSIKLGFIISVAIVFLFIAFSGVIAKLFVYSNYDSSFYSQLIIAIQILSFYILTVPFGSTASNLFQAMGKGINALFITFIRELLIGIVLAIILGIFLDFNSVGIYGGIVIGGIIGSLIGYYLLNNHISKVNQ